MFKVFLVEDEIVVREGIRKSIPWEQYGFMYAGDASDGELALPMIRKIEPDLIITDIKMPFMDGLSLIELVRKDLPNAKIVIISGYDDFSYAQQAIRMGVDQYLLKPIIKEKMVEILLEMYERLEEEQQQKKYIENFRREAQEYENFSRRNFFEQIITGGLSVSEISETAKEMGIDLNAPFYNLVLFSLNSTEYDGSMPEGYTKSLSDIQEKVTQLIVSNPDLLLFRCNITTYAILVKGMEENIKQLTQDCIENIKRCCATAGHDVDWYIACGTPVSRLSAIPACYEKVSRILSYRYLCPEEHIMSEELIRNFQKKNISKTDIERSEIEQANIRKFLSSGTISEINHFMDQLVKNADEKVVSIHLFCRYLSMTLYFTTVEYLDSIGCRADIFWSLELWPKANVSTVEDVRKYGRHVLGKAIEQRDLEHTKLQSDVLKQAIDFINNNFSDTSISLDMVAKEVNISPNYLSAIFSQEVGQTLTEYITFKRIEKAKHMLRQTDMRLNEIAFDIGYKDPRYFSFVFKKTSGCTPSEYRKGNKQ